MKKTKIVATIGPVSDSPEMLVSLIKAGANIFRFNMKHADIAWHDERIARVRDLTKQEGLEVGILIDLQGPEIRLETHGKQELSVTKGQTVRFVKEASDDASEVVLPTPEVFAAVRAGNTLLIDDGLMAFDVVEATPTYLSTVAQSDCVIKHRKSVNFPLVDIPLPSLTENDYEKLNMKNVKQVDYVALSFTRTKEDVEILRREMDKREIKAQIVAKIENQMALDHLEEIVSVCDVVMVARGDLAVEIPFERLAYEQKQIIALCNKTQTPVITATQMLHSMVNNPRPTRAEMCDVANAVYDGTDATMLSEETAGGKHPLIVVQTMAKILEFTETVAPHVSTTSWK